MRPVSPADHERKLAFPSVETPDKMYRLICQKSRNSPSSTCLSIEFDSGEYGNIRPKTGEYREYVLRGETYSPKA